MPSALRAQWNALVGRAWPVWGSAVLVATINVFLFAFDRPWTASDGMRNWGDWVLTGLGIVHRPELLAPWLYSGSLLNGGVLLGGLVAALLASEFAVRVPPRGELVKGALGGLVSRAPLPRLGDGASARVVERHGARVPGVVRRGAEPAAVGRRAAAR